jgi:hypothetical protein
LPFAKNGKSCKWHAKNHEFFTFHFNKCHVACHPWQMATPICHHSRVPASFEKSHLHARSDRKRAALGGNRLRWSRKWPYFLLLDLKIYEKSTLKNVPFFLKTCLRKIVITRLPSLQLTRNFFIMSHTISRM